MSEESDDWEELEQEQDLLDELQSREEDVLPYEGDEFPTDLEWLQYYYENHGFWYEGE